MDGRIEFTVSLQILMCQRYRMHAYQHQCVSGSLGAVLFVEKNYSCHGFWDL